MRNIYSAFKSHILLADGASEKMWQDLDHNIEPVDILNITNPDIVMQRHLAYLKAGSDVIHTNSFGAFPLDLKKEGYAEEAFIVNYLAAETAARAVDTVPGNGRRRFVAGTIQARNLEQNAAQIEAAATLQTEGLITGGADFLAVYLLNDGNNNDNTRRLLKGIIAKRNALNQHIPIYIYHQHTANNKTIGAADLADGVIKIVDGEAMGDKWLAVALSGTRPNLITGGDTVQETAVIDASLRAWSSDGLRPSLKNNRRILDEGFMPASSSRRFEELKPAR